MTAIYSENHTKHCEQTAEFFNVKNVVHIITSVI
jgi:hypothetical protein